SQRKRGFLSSCQPLLLRRIFLLIFGKDESKRRVKDLEMMKNCSRHVLIIVLFFGALMTTLSAISGVGVKDVKAWYAKRALSADDTRSVLQNRKMKTTLKQKQAP